MALILPSYDEVTKRIRADIQRFLPNLDPTIFGSLIRAIADSNAGRHFDNVLSIDQLVKELFPTDQTTRDSLDIWAGYEGIVPFVSTQSVGNAVFLGTPGSIINAGDEFNAENGNTYTVDDNVTISTISISIFSLTRSGTTVTRTTSTAHNLASNLIPTISGAVETDYNGLQLITVLTATTFSYEITGTPTTPATGTILLTYDGVLTALTSVGFGSDQNLDSGAKLTATATISGVDSEGFTDVNGMIGGQDNETSAEILIRIIQSSSNPVANFNEADIEKVALSVQGVTRVKVKRITPVVGAVTILFVRDNDNNIIPSGAEVLEVKNAILENLPATSEEDDVIVTAPTPVETDYTFSSISPSTETMKDAIIANLKAFYEDEVTFETNIQEDKYRAAITNTIDPETGNILLLFTLSSPTADIPITTDEIGTLGTVTF